MIVPGMERSKKQWDPVKTPANDNPKFSSWGKTELCQVLDVEPITLSGKLNNC